MNVPLRSSIVVAVALLLGSAGSAAAQPEADPDTAGQNVPQTAAPPHDHAAMMAAQKRWQVMWDGLAFATFSHQGGQRGGDEIRAQNWAMVTARRQVGWGTLALSGMASLEPVTVGPAGYAQLFQLGETYRKLPVTDRQHPHDLFMQLEAAWRQPIGRTELSIAGGPIGAPALGPPAFPHRPSASENPTAPLTHHTFDSTHIAMGTVTAGLRYGGFTIEASAFRGREPDEHRYDLEIGPLDSRSARVTWRPWGGLELQASRAYLHQPERLEPGNQLRTNASVAWLHRRADRAFSAITIMTGRVTRTYSWTGAVLVEGIHWMRNTAVYGRYEGLGLETEHLMFPQVVHLPHPGELVDPLHAATLGVVRRIVSAHGIDLAIGGDATVYRIPGRLEPTHGAQPISAHLFFRIRPLRTAGHPMEHDH